ncbi:glucosamine-6-phosphate deaminase [Planctomicrobium sp. SH661]|uniref:glucosamine-6-phosphate deaminase n=1 Tax=Planctomicrobium sp. SH661 TaxID=3448124 RepID=UPI003F5B60E6
MNVVRCRDAQHLGANAAAAGAAALREVLAAQPEATILVATGASQFEMLKELVASPGIDWSRVTAFHLDEYLGISSEHPASFRRYLKERFVSQVPLREFHYVNGEAANPQDECDRLEKLIQQRTIDVAFIGIGENSHLAFNDPPADFDTQRSYLVVNLDQACRQQQFGEGWFPSLEAVPKQAISMSVSQIMKARRIICSVPDERKARAVQLSVEGPCTPQVPASILQRHPGCTLFIDVPAASQLQQNSYRDSAE